MRQPTQAEINEAKEYILKRLDAESMMRRGVASLLHTYAIKLVKLVYSYGQPPAKFSFDIHGRIKREVDKLISQLINDLEDYAWLLAVNDSEDEDEIIAYAFRMQYGMTFSERLKQYADRYRNELEGIVAACALYGLNKSETEKTVGNDYLDPLSAQIVAKAMADDDGFLARLDIKSSFGRGRRHDAAGAIADLTAFAVAEGWKRAFAIECDRRGVYGYWCRRGSSYPCSQCDEECSYFHTDWDTLPPFHGHCKCYAIPIFLKNT